MLTPQIGATIKSFQERFRKLFREATIDGIVLREEITRQTPVLLNFPGELSKLLQSLKAFDMELVESQKVVLQIDPSEPCTGQKSPSKTDAPEPDRIRCRI